jgi:hypothetical protein
MWTCGAARTRRKTSRYTRSKTVMAFLLVLAELLDDSWRIVQINVRTEPTLGLIDDGIPSVAIGILQCPLHTHRAVAGLGSDLSQAESPFRNFANLERSITTCGRPRALPCARTLSRPNAVHLRGAPITLFQTEAHRQIGWRVLKRCSTSTHAGFGFCVEAGIDGTQPTSRS